MVNTRPKNSAINNYKYITNAIIISSTSSTNADQR